MKPVLLLLFFSATCYCEIEFSERPRNFSIELLHYTQQQTKGHVVISPFGIWSLMTGVALGATGDSYKQLRRAFILPRQKLSLVSGYRDLNKAVLSSTSQGVSLTTKNFVFLDKDFTVFSDFKDTLQKEFDASVKVLDFSDPNSARDANTYIERSGARVSNVLRSDDFKESRMILTNVISFKGLWKTPFNKSDTVLEPFYNERREKIGDVNMMFQKGQFGFANIQGLKAFALEIPYGTDGKYCMLFLLPYPNIDINEMYLNFALVGLKDVFKRLDDDEELYGLEDIDVKIPRFHINTNVVLNKPLNDMGVIDIFQPELAQFAKATKEAIFVSAIVHTADIDVTESGTVATAVTTATFADRITTPLFHANRPFLYFVMEKSTTTVIFAGIYSKPTVY